MTDELDENVKNKLSKIVKLVKHGVEGESEAARHMLTKFCDKYELDFYEVLEANDETKIRKFEIKYKNARERNVICRVLAKIHDIKDGFYYNGYRRAVYLECMPEKYYDSLYVVDQYLQAYRKAYRRAMKDVPRAFTIKHELWAPSAESSGKQLTYEQWKDLERQQSMAEGMSNVNIRKGIEAKI